MRRPAAFALVFAVLLGACANEQLGQEAPVCPPGPNEINFTTGLIIQMQAMPEARFVPCVDALQVGWKYEHVRAQDGRARFWLSSDRLGDRFVEVSLQESCDVGAQAESMFMRQGISSFSEIDLTSSLVTPVIIPVTGKEMNFALLVRRVLDNETLNGREVFTSFDRRQLPLVDKIAEAHAAGSPVIIIDELDAAAGTTDLILPGEVEGRTDLAVYDVIRRLDSRIPGASYRGTWYHLFAGGCITYEFNATGTEVDSLEADMVAAVGFVDADFARQILRDAGILE